MGISGAQPFALSPEELVALYLQLRIHEPELDRAVEGVMERLCGLLYGSLSIDEMEHLEDYYSILQASDRTSRR